PVVEQLEDRIVLDGASAGLFGINSQYLTTPSGTLLDGAGNRIGQVELQRPANPSLDRRFHTAVNPAGVSDIGAPASADSKIERHPTWVAGVMIGDRPGLKGVAPGASLYSSAFVGFPNTYARWYERTVIAAQFLAASGTSSINYSYGLTPFSGGGTSLASLGLDWLTTDRNVLNVFAGTEVGGGSGDVPGDAYNGIVVGATQKNNAGTFANIATFNVPGT